MMLDDVGAVQVSVRVPSAFAVTASPVGLFGPTGSALVSGSVMVSGFVELL